MNSGVVCKRWHLFFARLSPPDTLPATERPQIASLGGTMSQKHFRVSLSRRRPSGRMGRVGRRIYYVVVSSSHTHTHTMYTRWNSLFNIGNKWGQARIPLLLLKWNVLGCCQTFLSFYTFPVFKSHFSCKIQNCNITFSSFFPQRSKAPLALYYGWSIPQAYSITHFPKDHCFGIRQVNGALWIDLFSICRDRFPSACAKERA